MIDKSITDMDTLPDNQKMKRKALLMQLRLSLVATVCALSPGMTLAFPAVTLPEFKNVNATFYVTEDEASWIASLSSVAPPIGCLLAGLSLDKLGRKITIIILNMPGLMGWLSIAFAAEPFTLEMIYAGRILTGISLGMMNSPAAVYLSEICRDKIRGMFVNFGSLSFSMGMVFMYVLGAIVPNNWRIIAKIAVIVTVSSTIIAFLLPETPSYLLYRNRQQKAKQSFKRIRGIKPHEEIPETFKAEFDKLINNVSSRTKEKHGLFEVLSACKEPSAWKPFVIMSALFFFQQFSGIYVTLAYTVDVLQQFGVVFNPYYVAIALGMTRFLGTFVLAYLSMRFGRRKLIITSGTAMFICFFGLTLFKYLQTTETVAGGELTWLSVILLILLICSATLGYLSLPWSMIGEVYPLKVRGLLSSLTTCVGYSLQFIVLKSFPSMVVLMSISGVYLFFSIMILLGVVFASLFLPETQGKTLAEIEEEFNKRKSDSTAFFS